MKNFTGKFPVISIGTGIEEINFLKILFTQNSVTQRIPGKMQDQYYQNNHGQ